jgi:epoxyqueuosine reductase
MTSEAKTQRAGIVKQLARAAGFDLVGVAGIEASKWGDAYRAWIAAGKHGEMNYLAETAEERIDLSRKLPWAKSVICVGLSYGGAKFSGEAGGKIARYAWGRDYHKVFDGKLRKLEREMRAAIGEFTSRTWSDAQVIMEREYAMRAGLGWVGKNTLVIHPKHGSYFLLGELVTSLEIASDEAVADHCGTCRRCIEACPTDAITPYSVDATRCISYLTIEHRGPIAPEFESAMTSAGYVVGCDICQEVCPFNRAPLQVGEPDFKPAGIAVKGGVVKLPVIEQWDEHAWDVATRGKAYRRVKLNMWKRNAAIVAKGETQ